MVESHVRRVFVEKKPGFDLESRSIYLDLKENLGMTGLEGVRVLNRYDVSGVTEEEYRTARRTIFSEPTVDDVYDEEFVPAHDEKVFALEYLPGQYNQRADSAAQCMEIITQKERPQVQSAKVIVLKGEVSQDELSKVKDYFINPVDSREAALEKPETLDREILPPEDVPVLAGFQEESPEGLQDLHEKMGLAMSGEDLAFCQTYFRERERRDPTFTEIRVIDTYWSDHCRHTTFLTAIEEVELEKGYFSVPVNTAYRAYLSSRDFVYGDFPKEVSLMDLATMAMRELKKKGKLPDLDESEEINACSIEVTVDVDGKPEEWLVMFKNETHNHPTEIEPFGGAATCLGGAIRDPLSGRSYVYQAMRVTGSGDPRTRIEDTLPGKLPQRKITTGAAAGYSSYGNQIGLATGQVAEVYHEDFVAKRMEIGAVIGAAPKKNVVRQKPEAGDVVILLGGQTGRDGIGGATGSSKEHTEESILTCGAEVQKGNPPTERKIQRLFRHPRVSTMIKRCNDFGAGGVSVAIGELAEGLEINLDAVPKKYEGLDGTELAISESQERMAVVVAAQDAEAFIQYAREENLEAVIVAAVSGQRRLKMFWRGKPIVDISRDFLNTNGVKQKTRVSVATPGESENYFRTIPPRVGAQLPDLKQAWLTNLQGLNVCSQKGLIERFDSTIGAGTVLMPFGGKYQATPAEGMAAKIPVLTGETQTGTVMTYGYDAELAKWSPFHGALYAVTEAVAKIVVMGGSYQKTRLSLQEYFEKLGKEPSRWGKPFSALLGAFYAQKKLGIAAIGGKDSMSGTFRDLNVPPTLVAFAVSTLDVTKVISPEFKQVNSKVVYLPLVCDEYECPDFGELKAVFAKVEELIQSGAVLSAITIKSGGLAEAVTKMCLGNRIGVSFWNEMDHETLFSPDYGSMVLEIDETVQVKDVMGEVTYEIIGHTLKDAVIAVNDLEIGLEEAGAAWEKPLEKIFPTKTEAVPGQPKQAAFPHRCLHKPAIKIARPKVFIPVFPGTNCEYDTVRSFEKAGAQVETMVVRNLSPADIAQSIAEMVKGIETAQIVMLSGGFSAGDEPDGSGKFIAAMFRNPWVKEAVTKHLKEKDGLMLGICNGFQALIKLGLVPYGEIIDLTPDCPTLTYNKIGRHVSCLVQTKVVSTLSPWFHNMQVGDRHTIAVSHGEGRFVANAQVMETMMAQGQIATQYVDFEGNPSFDIRFNPNGSVEAVEGITSPDGRVLGKMGHSERMAPHVAVNVPGEKDQPIFAAGVNYFK
ncbi:phosphoribosylformylglycinamidine synthase [Candidatus Formimonas warabiya]|uniref:Phosphoribosylformylglycinamidine synthase n=1 Tax=Formimonas warabiya TaxID=1761012 RepID=A0A3G1KLW8_FORW1|nr:phosphoribosylformylglycinamidine synthase [Candidatus Formimonas warabiya]ATW23417.1 phosphoribosylformylglycinamidine synthase [Candidatus Formimonas warabiya]